jgi:hypothetical protein
MTTGMASTPRDEPIIAPDQSEALHATGVDLAQFAVSGLSIVETDGRPIVRRRRGGFDEVSTAEMIDLIRPSAGLSEFCADVRPREVTGSRLGCTDSNALAP